MSFMLNTGELLNLVQIVKSGSLARAAAELGVSQPALSKSVARLERSLGVRLLERKARGVVATDYGEALLRRVVPVLADLRAAAQEIEALRGGARGVVSIGAAPAVAVNFMPPVIEKVRKSDRQVVVRVLEGLVEPLLAALRAGSLDFAITTRVAADPPDDLAVRPLFEDTFVVCCAGGHPLARKRKVSASDLTGLPWVLAPRDGVLRHELDHRFAMEGAVAPAATVETASGALSKALVMNGEFIGFLPREMIAFEERKGYVAVVPTPWLEWKREICLVTRRGHQPSRSAAFVSELVLEEAGRRRPGRAGR
jgi:DNA-binding transcriptional LysR family regulator